MLETQRKKSVNKFKCNRWISSFGFGGITTKKELSGLKLCEFQDD